MPRRLVLRTVAAAYLAVTAAAFVFTMTRISILPWPLFFYSYGMMAPYQTYTTYNADVVAEGRTSTGAWKTIDLSPYYPQIRGEANLRKFLLQSRWLRDDPSYFSRLQERYTDLAWQVLLRAQGKGEDVLAVRLHWVEWPASPGGYEAMRDTPFLESTFITQVP